MNIHLLVEDFCLQSRYMRGVTDQTILRYQQNINNFIRSEHIESIHEITKEKVFQFFLKGRIDRGWKTRTYHTYYQTLKVFFRWCVNHGYMGENYTDQIELPKREKLLPKGLSLQDANLVLETVFHYRYTQEFARYRNYALFALFLHAGLRKSEALKLTLSDVDMEGRSIFVRCGKGNKDRIVPMSATLVHILELYLKVRRKSGKTSFTFFTSSNKDQGFTDNGLKKVIDMIRKRTGIHLTPHALRHTFATLMLEGGCDIFSLSKMMGHSDIKTTTIYLSTTVEHLQSQMMKHPLNRVSTTSRDSR